MTESSIRQLLDVAVARNTRRAFIYGPFGGKSENPRTKRRKKAQRRARKARRKGEAR